jgi:hypothetical protein
VRCEQRKANGFQCVIRSGQVGAFGETVVTVSLDEGLGQGILVLSGARLPYLVVCPPAAKP